MIAIIHGTIYPMSGDKIEDGMVLMEDGKIKAVGKDLDIPKDATIIDAKGRLVTPGLIDGHCHIGMWEEAIQFEGDDGNEMTSPTTPELQAIDSINPMDEAFKEAVEGGVTTAVTGPGSANVMGGTFCAIKTYGHRVDDMLIKNPVAMKIAFGENPKRVYSQQKKTPSTRMATAAILRQTLHKAMDYYRKKQAGKEQDYDLGMEALIPVLEKKIPLKAHAHRADDIFTAIRIAKEFNLDMTLDHCTEGHLIVEDLKKESYPALVGPTFGNRSKVELKNKSFITPGVLSKAGMKVAIITDSPVIPLHHLPLCAALAKRDGLEEMEAWRAISLYPAQIVGIDDRVGSLEPAKMRTWLFSTGIPWRMWITASPMSFADGKPVFISQSEA